MESPEEGEYVLPYKSQKKVIVLDHGAQEGMWQGWAGGEKSGTEHAVPVGHVQSFDYTLSAAGS